MPISIHTLSRTLDPSSRARNPKPTYNSTTGSTDRVTVSLLEQEAQALVRLLGAVELDMDATSAIVSLAAQLQQVR